MEQESSSWRKLLGRIISSSPLEKQRIANAIGVNAITLMRWAEIDASSQRESDSDKSSRPRWSSLRRLVEVLPQYREQLVASIFAEFPNVPADLFQSARGNEGFEVPLECYRAVLEVAATLSPEMRFFSIFDHILASAVRQLDPDGLGLAMIVVCCTPPKEGRAVRSLRELLRMGTPPWKGEREERKFFLGAESLSGYTVSTCRPYEIEDVRTYNGLLPHRKLDYEVSVASCPITRYGHVAGCLIAISTQPGYFNRARTHLIQEYCYLAIEAFREGEFYEPKNVQLNLMPDSEVQEPFLYLFNKHVEDLLIKGEAPDRLQAERMVLHRIEDDLIYWRSTHGSPMPMDFSLGVEAQ
jgi:hypothetical protein